MRNTFFLFQSHLDLAHSYWTTLVQPGDHVIDATCGNGHDTLKLARLALAEEKGKVYAFDIQELALQTTRQLLEQQLTPLLQKNVALECRCHSTFPADIPLASIKLIVYNLGYLPRGNKELTTQTATTLQSLKAAQELLQPGGAICLTCYPGHPEGALEEEAILQEVALLSAKEWSCCHHRWINRSQAPSLLLLQKSHNCLVAQQ